MDFNEPFPARLQALIGLLRSKHSSAGITRVDGLLYPPKFLAIVRTTPGSLSTTWFAEEEIPLLNESLEPRGYRLVVSGEVNGTPSTFNILKLEPLYRRGSSSPGGGSNT